MEPDIITIDVSIPPDAHPGTLVSENASLKSAMEITYKTWSGVNTAERKLDEVAKGDRPTPPGKRMDKTEKAFFQQKIDEWMKKTSVYKSDLARESTPKIESVLSRLDKALAGARSEAKALEGEIDKDLVPRPVDTSYDGEIREQLRKSGGKTPLDVLIKAVGSHDRRVIAAVLGAPPFLLGIDQKTHDLLKETAINRYCKEKNDKLQALQRDIVKVEKTHSTFLERMGKSIASWQSQEQQIIKDALS